MGRVLVLRIVYLGMTGLFSRPPLEKLLEAGVEVAAVIVPAPAGLTLASGLRRLPPLAPPPTDLPVLNPHLEHHIIHLAWGHDIPVWEVTRLTAPAVMALCTELAPDLLVVACFSQRLPPALLALPRYGCLNLHPSLLPAYRGPAPLFWQARHGVEQTGVTLHFMDEGLDSGAIVGQRALAWPEGATQVVLDRRCAAAGATLLVEAVQRLAGGGTLPARPQNEAEAGYFAWPTPDDFQISTEWPARRAFNFMRFAAGEWPLWLEHNGRQIFIRIAISYDPRQILAEPIIEQEPELWVQFKPGVVRLRPGVILG
jgi:methionyl-tRNA formyltransferase